MKIHSLPGFLCWYSPSLITGGVLTLLSIHLAGAGQQWNYTGADNGLWNTPANWTLNGGAAHLVPVIGDNANLGLALTVGNVTLNSNYTGAGLFSLTLDSPGHSSITLNQNAASTMIATNEYIGTTVSGNTYNQSAGTNTVSNLYLGFGNGGFGNYSISGTGVLNSSNAVIGNVGTGGGIFTQSGGTHNVAIALIVGEGGTNLNNAYNMTGGTLAMGNNAFLVVGNNAHAAFTQSAGAVTFAGTAGLLLVGGGAASGTGNTYTLSGTGTITGPATFTVGASGGGAFMQTGGTVTLGAGGNLSVGDLAGSTGIYNLSAGTGTGALNVANSTVGNSGTGTFTQNGGSLGVSNTFNVALNSGSNGTFSLNGGTVSVGSNASVGIFGTGILNMSGGTFGTAGMIFGTGLNLVTTGNGTFNLSSGTATTGVLNVGFNLGGTGQIIQTGGTLNVTAPGTNVLSLGTNAGGIGSYTMDTSVGASALNVGTLRVGDGGTGTLTQNGGTVTTGAIFTVGRQAGSNGTYNLNGGVLNAGVSLLGTNVTVGGGGTGTMNQTGGTFTIGNNAPGSGAGLSLGGTGGTGTYNLSGGSLTTVFLRPGNTGTGNFIQTGGTVNATQLDISSTAGSNGSYSLSGAAGVTLTVSSLESIGTASAGTFTQSGGTHTLNGDMQLGQAANGSGTYSLSGGALNVNANVGVGQSGIGFLNQTGGALAVSGGLYVGSGSGSNGNYQISSGTASVGTLYLGYTGVGNLYQNGGTLTVGTLYGGTIFTNFTAATGTHTQTGGTLNVTNSFQLGIGGATANYNFGGNGVLNVPNNPNFSQALFIGSRGTFTQYGGTVNGYVSNAGQFIFQGGTFNGTLENGAGGTADFDSFVYFGSGLKNHGTLNIGAGGQVGTATLQAFTNDGTINLSGTGQIYSNGPITNNGLITGTGAIGGSGTFVNNLSLTQGAGPLTLSFAPGNAVNNGTVTLAPGRALNLLGGFTNAGTFDMNGASILQNGVLANAAGGTVTGPGAILSNFMNSGVVTPGGGTLNIANPWTNNGIAQLSHLSDSLTGGTITNAGTIQGFGHVGAGVNNPSGVIEAIGGTLSLGGALTNPTGGTLASGTGTKLTVIAGLGTNAGIISLVGGTFDNNSHPMTNTGQISGYGIVRTGGAGLTNAGSITFTGGNTTVNGNVANNSGQTIRISYNPATFTGNVVNNGTFKTTSTTSTFTGSFTNNGVFTSDPAVQTFSTLVIGPTGALIGGNGDVFNISADLVNRSAQSTLWDTAGARIAFTGASTHAMTWSAADAGAAAAGYGDNFAVGEFSLEAGNQLTLWSGDTAGGALYVGWLDLPGGVAQLDSITSNGVNVYYDALLTGNSYLANRTFALNGGSMLAPVYGVPEPGTSSVLGAVLALAAMIRRRSPRPPALNPAPAIPGIPC